MKTIIKNIELNTKTDKRFPVNLLSGSLYRVENGLYYIHGGRPIGNDYAKEVFKGTTEEWNENTKTVHKVPYEWTEYISLLSADDVINLFIEEISRSAVIIKDAEFLLKCPIVTTGHAKILMDKCTVNLEGDDAGFITVNSMSAGGTEKGTSDFDLKDYIEKLDDIASKGNILSRNVISPATYYKYGSRYGKPQIKRHWPENTEYHFKVSKQDKIIESSTDKRGYPQSCGKENREKGVTVIVHNDVLKPEMEPIKIKCGDQVIGVSKDRNIIVVDKAITSYDELKNLLEKRVSKPEIVEVRDLNKGE